MNIINDLKRLERAGNKNSRATQKLHDSVRNIADMITKHAPIGVDLPRGYYLVREADGCDYLSNSSGLRIELVQDRTRQASLQFAADVAEGLLGEIAELLEARKSEAITTTRAMREAAAKQNQSNIRRGVWQ